MSGIVLDIVLVLLLLGYARSGYSRGVVVVGLSLVGFVLGAVIGVNLMPVIVGALDSVRSAPALSALVTAYCLLPCALKLLAAASLYFLILRNRGLP